MHDVVMFTYGVRNICPDNIQPVLDLNVHSKTKRLKFIQRDLIDHKIKLYKYFMYTVKLILIVCWLVSELLMKVFR